MFSIIVAHDEHNGIGKQQSLPWNIPEDMKFFMTKTKGSTVIMGKNTYFSMGKPLPHRENIVVSSTIGSIESSDQYIVASSLDDALRKASAHTIFVIGGQRLYKEALQHPGLHKAYITHIEGDYHCDAFFPVQHIPVDAIVSTEMTLNDFTHVKVHERNVEEYQYLDLVRKILHTGEDRSDRTGVGTRSIFGTQMRFNLEDRFPLLTTKRVFWRGLVEELFWFMRGDTSATVLQDKKVHIWDGNSSREFLDSRGLNYQEGELGPVYGYQWRCFGGDYPEKTNGIDQLQQVIDLIRHNPDSRRIILSAWNPQQQEQMALPPCHVLYQFYVTRGRLSCSMYQRSGDIGLGVPFNIASASLLTCILAKHCDLLPGELVHSIGDAHIYSTHIEAIKVQIERTPRLFPRLVVKSRHDSIEAYSMDDLELTDYEPLKGIKMAMSI